MVEHQAEAGNRSAGAERRASSTAFFLPVVMLTAPSAGAVFSQGDAISLTATATNSTGGISKVEFFVNGAKVGEDTSSPYAFSWTAATAGDYSITAKATDDAQGTTESAAVKISVLAGTGKIYRILPLGNSITYDNYSGDTRPTGQRTSYRYKLWQLLRQDGYRVDFVGSRYSGGDFFPDANNAGIPGIRDDQLQTVLNGGSINIGGTIQETTGPFLETYPADIILLHIGTNSVSEDPNQVRNILDIIDEYETENNVSITVILAQIINRITFSQTTSTFNDNIKTMAEARIANGDKIVIVNMEEGANLIYSSTQDGGDMHDDLHPNTTGYEKMAAVWYTALKGVLGQSPLAVAPASPADVSLYRVYPNPTDRDELTVAVTSDITSPATISLTDMTGRLVRQQAATIVSGENQLQLSLASLPAGTYFMRLVLSKTGEVVRSKVVKL